MTTPTDLPPELRALMLRTLIGEAQHELDEIKKGLRVRYQFPTTVPFESPLDGARLGSIVRERVTPEWRVTSRPQLVEHYTAEYPGVLETVFMLDVGLSEPVALPEDHPVTVALAQSAPELLTPVRRVPEQVIEDALQASRDSGQPAAPGIQLVRPRQGNIVVNYDKREAPAAIRRMLRAGLVSLPWDEPVAVEAASDGAE